MLGIPGSGKGTQAKRLSKKLKLPHISSGDIFRDIDISTKLGQKVRQLIDKGEYVPDNLAIKIVKKRLLQDDCKNGVILDGFPRTLEQVKEFEKFFNLDYILFLSISENESVKRQTGRRTCPNKECGIPYNVYTEPRPQVEGICDKCGSKLFQRKDESEKAVKVRLKVFNRETKPLVKYYRSKGMMIEIDGHKSIDKVFKEICKVLGV